MRPFADEFIERHFQAWLDRHAPLDGREEMERKIREFCAANEDYWGDKSWPELRDMAGA